MKKIATVLAALLVSMNAATAFSAEALKVSPSMREAFNAHMNSVVDNEPYSFNLAEESQHDVMIELLRLSGVTEKSHPDVFRNLRYSVRHDTKHQGGWRTAPYEDENPLGYIEDVQQITSLIQDDDSGITATGYYSAVKSGAESGVVTLTIHGYNTADKRWEPLGSTDERIDETTCSNIINLKTVAPLDSSQSGSYSAFRATLLWSVLDQLSRTQNNSLTLTTAGFPEKMELLAPQPTKGGDYIKVCMNRLDRYNNDCDYVINSDKEIVAFPLEGSVTFPGPIWQPGEKEGYDPVVSIKTVKLPLGGGCRLKDLEESFWELPGVKVEGSTVSWDITPAEFQETQKTCFGYGDKALFTMNINGYLKEQSGPLSSVAASYSNDANVTEGAGAIKMDPLEVYYGCLAENTEVMLANAKKPLKIDSQALIGKTVANRAGIAPLQVAGNAYGYEAGYMLKITTDKNHSVTLTKDHPIWVNGEFIDAIDTRLFDEVMTSDGKAVVTGLNLIADGEKPAKVWNIFLERPAGEGVAPIQERSFYADGILVGDGSVQEYNILWNANAACRPKTPHSSLSSKLVGAADLQPAVTEAVWDETTSNLVVKWDVNNPTPQLFSFILTTITGDTYANVGEVPESQRCLEYTARSKPDEVIITGSDGTSPIGKPSAPPTPVTTGTGSCS
jgi:hypothetical protein